MAVIRGCGTRTSGGIYSVCKLGDNGLPLEYFLYDPPVPVDMNALGISAIGTHLVEQAGIWHIMDWVGEAHYPNVADFLEEVRRYGLSRKLNPTMGFEKLTRDSRHILIHPRGWINQWQEYLLARDLSTVLFHAARRPTPNYRCTKEVVAHSTASATTRFNASAIASFHQGLDPDTDPTHAKDTPCNSLWWEDVVRGDPATFYAVTGETEDSSPWGEDVVRSDYMRHMEMEVRGIAVSDRVVIRTMPSFAYTAHRPPLFPPGSEPVSRQPALIARFPIHALEIVANPDDPEQQRRAYDAASHAALPVDLCPD